MFVLEMLHDDNGKPPEKEQGLCIIYPPPVEEDGSQANPPERNHHSQKDQGDPDPDQHRNQKVRIGVIFFFPPFAGWFPARPGFLVGIFDHQLFVAGRTLYAFSEQV